MNCAYYQQHGGPPVPHNVTNNYFNEPWDGDRPNFSGIAEARAPRGWKGGGPKGSRNYGARNYRASGRTAPKPADSGSPAIIKNAPD
ncbi:unnamed protein product [Leptosia nina]|uniref:Uncharacterized protein n=1 Tax=Leptosia nina TaxID=320188 RepID=A0AAV1JUU7_9NEOP